MHKVTIPLIITGSSRKESNTQAFIDLIFNDERYTHASLTDHTILPYRYDGNYGNDDFDKLTQLILDHDVILFATPVYWYSMSGIMKNFFDRFTDWVTINKETGRKMKGKTFLLFATGGDPYLPEGFEVPFQRTAHYFDATYAGSLFISESDKDVDGYLARAKLFTDKVRELCLQGNINKM